MTQAKIVPSIKASDPLSGPLPSWSQGSLLAPIGNNAFLSDPALAGQAVGDQIDHLALGIQRAALYSGQIESHFKAMADQTKSMHEEAVKASKEVSNQHKDAARAVVAGYQASMVSDGPAKIRPSGVAEGSADDNRLGGMTFAQARTMGGNFGQLKQYGSQRADRWMSDWGARQAAEMPVQNSAGKFIDPATGRYLPQAESAAKAARIGSSLNRIGQATGVIDAVGAGEGMSGLVGLAGKAAGPIGMAIGAGQLINSQMINQRKTNAAYQNIYGGANTDAFGQRAQEFGFSHFGTAGTMGSEEAGQLFKGVSQLGLKDDKRQKMLDFAVDQYKKTGMDVSTSLELIGTATKNGAQSMDALQSALDGVAASAKKSGMNLGDVQKSLSGILTAVSGSLTTLPAGAGISGGLQQMKNQLGKSLTGVDFTPMVTSRQFALRAATLNHMTPGEWQAKITTDSSLVGKSMDLVFEEMARNLWLKSDYKQRAKQEADKIKSQKKTLEDGDYAIIGNVLMNEQYFSPDAVMIGLNSLQLPITYAQIPPFMAKWALGEITPGKTMNAAVKSALAPKKTTAPSSKPTTRFGSATSPVYGSNTPGLGNGPMSFESSGSPAAGGGAVSKALVSKHLGADTRFTVKTPDGKTREVGLDEAIHNYQTQVESGNVKISRGALAGQTVGQVTGTSSAHTPAPAHTQVTVQAIGDLDKLLKIHVQGGPGVAAARAAGVPASATANNPSGWSP